MADEEAEEGEAQQNIYPENKTMFEAFEWYLPSDQQHWKRLEQAMPKLKSIGIDNVWLPPGCKAGSKHSNGYDLYDLYDLGEFDQKGTVGTKWGTKDELVSMANAAHEQGIGLYWDALLGHKSAADRTEKCTAIPVNPKNRLRPVGKQREIEAWLGFDFSARNGKYSTMRYDATHFNGVDYDHKTGKKGIWQLIGENQEKDWAQDVDKENGNFDFLLCANVDLSNHDVRRDAFNWVKWIGKELNISGLRMDAAKHTSRDFMRELLKQVDPSWTIITEYLSPKVNILTKYIDAMDGRVYAFDFALHSNFVNISHGDDVPIGKVYKDTLVVARPANTVTFVTNHDSQSLGREISPVAKYFIPLAYALILLSTFGGYPCVFYGDLYGVQGPKEAGPPALNGKLWKLILARKLYAYGLQKAYVGKRDSLGFTRLGHTSRSGGAGLAVLMTKGNRWNMRPMYVGKRHAGEIWQSILNDDDRTGRVEIDQRGVGFFQVPPASVEVWVDSKAEGREKFDTMHFP